MNSMYPLVVQALADKGAQVTKVSSTAGEVYKVVQMSTGFGRGNSAIVERRDVRWYALP